MIALLSLIGKIYENLIEKRIARVVEQQRNVPVGMDGDDIIPLAEEQHGFRHDSRSCNDAAWLLSGVIRANGRRKKKTYVAYLDIKKAYPKTNHAVLFRAVWNQGIRGPLYATIESHLRGRKHKILVNGIYTESYDVSVGLAEGSLLSPVLFSIFVNSIVNEINSVGNGVVLESKSDKFQIRCFLYADDLAIVADSLEDLNKMLRAANLWAAKNQTQFNMGKGKSEWVCYGASEVGVSGDAILGGAKLREVDEYRYLGIELHRELGFHGTLSWEHMQQSKEEKLEGPLKRASSAGNNGSGCSYRPYIQRCANSMTNKRGICKAMGMRGGGFSTRVAKKLMEVFIIPQANYNTQVWGMDSGRDALLECAQVEAAKVILGVGRTPVTYEKVRAELGLLSMARRRMIMDLIYYWKLVKMPKNRLQGQFVRFLGTDINGKGSSRNWLTEHVLPILRRWKLPECVDKIKLEDWRRLLRRKAYEEEEKALKEKCDVSKVEQVIFDYREVRSGHKRIFATVSPGMGAGQ